MKIVVRGYVGNWSITETEKGFLVLPNRKDKTIYYKSLPEAKKAIRYAENAYLLARGRENVKLANSDIWANFGILWIDDIDGNYY